MSLRTFLTLLATVAAVGAVTADRARAAEEAWRLVALPPAPGGRFSTPVGMPGDLSFQAPNRGLLTVGGNDAVPTGVYSWDGVTWHQLATVCGGGVEARVAWAGPREFWVVSKPSVPRVQLPGRALCHFKDGAVVGSYSAPDSAEDPFHPLSAAACGAPEDCWFGGAGAQDGSGARVGAFHLHWDGGELRTRYAPQGRAVSDIEPFEGELYASAYRGRLPEEPEPFALRDPEPVPLLLGRIGGGAFPREPFTFAPVPEVPDPSLQALDADGPLLWAVGGGYRYTERRPPVVALRDERGWRELTLSGDPLPLDHTLGDIAAVPGTRTAWATVTQGPTEGSQPRLARITADGEVTLVDLTRSGDAVRGAAVRVACPTATDCWMATARGFLYRLGGGEYVRDEDPAFQGTITERPNEALAQTVPDSDPPDDSRLFAPPVEIRPPAADDPVEECEVRRPLLSGVGRPKLLPLRSRAERAGRRQRLRVPFRLARRATVQLLGERRGPRASGGAGPRRGAGPRWRVVARSPRVTLRPGRRSVVLTAARTSWPTRLRFVTREARRPLPACPSEAAEISAATTATTPATAASQR